MGQKKGQGAGPRDGESSIRGRGIERGKYRLEERQSHRTQEFLGGKDNDRDGERRIGAEGQKEKKDRKKDRVWEGEGQGAGHRLSKKDRDQDKVTQR